MAGTRLACEWMCVRAEFFAKTADMVALNTELPKGPRAAWLQPNQLAFFTATHPWHGADGEARARACHHRLPSVIVTDNFGQVRAAGSQKTKDHVTPANVRESAPWRDSRCSGLVCRQNVTVQEAGLRPHAHHEAEGTYEAGAAMQYRLVSCKQRYSQTNIYNDIRFAMQTCNLLLPG